MSDSLITDLEQGYSLNVQSRCNSANANGIDGAFTDSPIPSTSYIYSIPGTASSTIRSIYTGSIPFAQNAGTESCSSRYGLQDVYGNVAEWVKDSMTCDVGYTCKSIQGTATTATDLGRYDFSTNGYSDTASSSYAFDLVTGPYNDQNADSIAGAGDGFLTSWDFRDELFGAGKFSFPMGMPMNVDIASTTVSTSQALSWLLDIGPTSGITTSQLHEDGIILNTANVNNASTNPTQTGSFAQGGSYLSGNRAGRYSSELIPDADLRSDVGFRCYIPIVNGNYPIDTGRHIYSY
jgi:hypothetical protein